jgi:hypothetical protein
LIEVGWAAPEDIPGAIAVLLEITEFRKSLGQDRWNKDWFTPKALQSWIDNRSLVVARLDGLVVGTMLVEDEDKTFWPDDPPGEALYVHRLARARTAPAAKGAAAHFLAFAEQEARGRGRGFVRLDCALDETLAAIYQGAAYRRLPGVWEVSPGFQSWRWEKRL